MYCSKCGTQNSVDANFCNKCGNKIDKIELSKIEKTIAINQPPKEKIEKEYSIMTYIKAGVFLSILFFIVISALSNQNSRYSEPSSLNSQSQKTVLITTAPSQILPTINDMADGTRKVSETANETYAEREFMPNSIFTQLLIYRVNKFPSIDEAINNYNTNKNKYSNYKLTSVNMGDDAFGLEEASKGATIFYRKANVVIQVHLLSPYSATLSEAKDYAKKVSV
ncbi:MAG: zinc-ribbon domain-containing protein [Candidatus Methanoperedens sp.]